MNLKRKKTMKYLFKNLKNLDLFTKLQNYKI